MARLATGSTHKTIYMPEIQSLRVPIPPIDEQRAIAERLKTEIDRSFTTAYALARQIDLFTEHRQALITAAVGGAVQIPNSYRAISLDHVSPDDYIAPTGGER